MAILDFQFNNVGQAGVEPQLMYVNTNDSVATVTSAGYLNRLESAGIPVSDKMMLMVCTKTSPGATASQTALYSVDMTTNSLLPTSSTDTLITWESVTSGTQLLEVNTGYIGNNVGANIDFTLPVSSNVGDVINVCGHSCSSWSVKQNAGQYIVLNGAPSTIGVAGSLDSAGGTGQAQLVCATADTVWVCFTSNSGVAVV